jgi:WD40 repeat protein
MKITDVEKLYDITTILTKDSITTSIDYSHNRVISSHEDGYIRLWDLRTPTNPSHTFKSHSKFSSCVKFNRNHNVFASVHFHLFLVIIWSHHQDLGLQIYFSTSKHRDPSWQDLHDLLEGREGNSQWGLGFSAAIPQNMK